MENKNLTVVLITFILTVSVTELLTGLSFSDYLSKSIYRMGICMEQQSNLVKCESIVNPDYKGNN